MWLNVLSTLYFLLFLPSGTWFIKKSCASEIIKNVDRFLQYAAEFNNPLPLFYLYVLKKRRGGSCLNAYFSLG